MEKRLKKECKVNCKSKNFKSKFGISNRLNPTVIYVEINSWLEHLDDFKNYVSNINQLNSTIKNEIKKLMFNSKIFESSFFYTPNIKKNITSKNNKFYASFEFTIKQKESISNDNDSLKKEIEILTNSIIEKIESFKIFKYNLTKN